MLSGDTDIAIRPIAHKRSMRLMGNGFEITAIAESAAFANPCIDKAVAEISRIERLLTTFNDSSQTALINANAGARPVKVDREVYDLIVRSTRISALTRGAFDITYGSVDKCLWNFDTTIKALPDKAAAKAAVRLINYRNIVTNAEACTISLKEKGMRIGFGGIGKGYAADRAKTVLQNLGDRSGIVNASGDLTVCGHEPDGRPWTIGIADPNHKEQPFAWMNITDMAIATSGTYEKYVVIDGQKYSHTIDPRTGFPVSGIKSVTIICPNAELADAMATPISIMGIHAGLDLINQRMDLACIIVDDQDRLYTSTNIRLS